MIALLQDNLEAVAEICRRRRVVHLAVFGSAVSSGFDPATSDVDLLVDFVPMSPREHADCYFGLLEDLERLLGVPIDLVESGPISNPFFRQVLAQTKVLLYAAA